MDILLNEPSWTLLSFGGLGQYSGCAGSNHQLNEAGTPVYKNNTGFLWKEFKVSFFIYFVILSFSL